VKTLLRRESCLNKLAKICGVTFFSNIATIENDLEEYVKELLDNATNQSHHIEIRSDNKRAGEEITIYDSKHKTMYHTAFSRLSRKEIDSMINTVKLLDSKGKYSDMRLLPISIDDIK